MFDHCLLRELPSWNTVQCRKSTCGFLLSSKQTYPANDIWSEPRGTPYNLVKCFSLWEPVCSKIAHTVYESGILEKENGFSRKPFIPDVLWVLDGRITDAHTDVLLQITGFLLFRNIISTQKRRHWIFLTLRKGSWWWVHGFAWWLEMSSVIWWVMDYV